MNNSKPALEKSKLDNVRAPKVFHKLHDSKSGFIIAYTYQVQSKKTLLAAKVSSTWGRFVQASASLASNGQPWYYRIQRVHASCSAKNKKANSLFTKLIRETRNEADSSFGVIAGTHRPTVAITVIITEIKIWYFLFWP